MDTKEIQGLLISAIEVAADGDEGSCDKAQQLANMDIHMYQEQGMLTRDAGFMIEINGDIFQVTIVKV